MSRYLAREAAFLVVFEHSFQPEQPVGSLIRTFYENEEFKSIEGQKAYFETVVAGVLAHEQELEELIERHACQWKKGRISRTAMAAMKVAMFEMLYCEDVGPKIAINEAVEILKKYDMDDTARFANGVLGGFWRAQQATADGAQ